MKTSPSRRSRLKLGAHRFLGGRGPILLVRRHETKHGVASFEVHTVDGELLSSGVCPFDTIPLLLRPPYLAVEKVARSRTVRRRRKKASA